MMMASYCISGGPPGGGVAPKTYHRMRHQHMKKQILRKGGRPLPLGTAKLRSDAKPGLVNIALHRVLTYVNVLDEDSDTWASPQLASFAHCNFSGSRFTSRLL